jgi:flagellar FliL protein
LGVEVNDGTIADAAAANAPAPAKRRGSLFASRTGVRGSRPAFIVSLLVVEVVAAYFVVTALIEPRLAEEPATFATDGRVARSGVGPMLAVDDVVVNLTASAEPHFLAASVAIELEPSARAGSSKALAAWEPRVKDVIVHTLSSKSDEDVRGMEGRERVRQELRCEIGNVLSPARVRAVYFTEFVVQ